MSEDDKKYIPNSSSKSCVEVDQNQIPQESNVLLPIRSMGKPLPVEPELPNDQEIDIENTKGVKCTESY